jgi:hypothetical protein
VQTEMGRLLGGGRQEGIEILITTGTLEYLMFLTLHSSPHPGAS